MTDTQEQAKLTIAELNEYIRINDEHESEHTAWLAEVGYNPEEHPHFCDYYGCQDISRLARALLASQTALREVARFMAENLPMLPIEDKVKAVLLAEGGEE